MIKNERLILSMTLPERIKLITSVDFYKNRPLGGYAFPVFELLQDPIKDRGAKVTAFPQDKTLACAWNPSLVTEVYKCIGNEAKAVAERAYYNVTNRTDGLGASDDLFTYGRFSAAKTLGLNKSGAFVNFEDLSLPQESCDEKIAHKLIRDVILSVSDPDSVIVKHADDCGNEKDCESARLMFGVAACKEEVAKYLADGYSFIWLGEDFTDELIPYLTELTDEYDTAHDACERGKITPEKLRLCCDELKMLPVERINEACDNIINLLIALDDNNADSVCERKISLGGAASPAFDEALHNSVALTAARQSAVLLKNNGILPLKHEAAVAVIGEYAKNPEYHAFGNFATAAGLPFDIINDYEIRTSGFAYGYRKGEAGRTDLHKTAVKLCKSSDAAIVYLCAEQGAKILPPEQLEIIDALYGSGVKIIAVVAADGSLELPIESKCDAIIYTGRGGQQTAAAVFEIITGFVNPSGKLAFAMPMSVNQETGEQSGERYPFGYGLSYTTFEYTKLKLDNGGVSLTVTNTGEYDGYANVQMYVRKTDGDARDKKLRGYEKVFVKKKDSVKVEIRFGEETFRAYDENRGLYCIEGGNYAISVGDSERNIRLKGELTLAPYTYDEEYFENEFVKSSKSEDGFKEFADSEDKRAFFARNRSTSLGLKLTLALFLMLYFDVSLALICVYNVVPDWYVSYIVIGVLAGAVNIAIIGFIIVAAKRHGREKSIAPEPLIGEEVAKLKEFTSLASVSYETPITPEEQEEDDAEEQETDEPPEEEPEEIILTYDTAFTDGERENIKFRENVSFTELCANFHDYMLGWGVEVESSSVRAFMAAFAASKLIFIDIKNKDVLPTFLLALSGYFRGAEVVETKESWNRPDHLTWTVEGDKYVASGFVNAVYAAAHTPDKNAVAILSRVRMDNLHNYFNDFIRYALFPSEEHVWRLNDDTKVILPHNLHYILVTEDGWQNMPRDVAGASVQIEMICSASSAPGESVEIKSVTSKGFEELVKESREEHFMSENIWKKIDELIEAINVSEKFAIGNKSLLQIERLTSAVMACGADESEAFSLAFTAKIVSRLKNLKMYGEDGGDKTVFGLIEKLFGDENLSKIQKALFKTPAVS